MTAKNENTSLDRENVGYKLPRWLTNMVRHEATDRGVYPFEIVLERLEESYRRRPPIPFARLKTKKHQETTR